jgi:hypothetical protein
VVDDDHRQPPVAQAPGQERPGIAEAADDDEGICDAAHMLGEAALGERLLKVRVLHQADDRAEGVEPGNHAGIERDDAPHALPLGERMGQLAKAGGGDGVGQEIEGMKQAELLEITIHADARDQDPADHGDRVDRDQHHDGPAHVAQHDEGDASGLGGLDPHGVGPIGGASGSRSRAWTQK